MSNDDQAEAMVKSADADARRLNRARYEAHQVFDRLWQERYMSRTKAYAFISKVLRVEDAHMATMNIEQCEKVMRASEQLLGISKTR